jgi:hypothetical protein
MSQLDGSITTAKTEFLSTSFFILFLSHVNIKAPQGGSQMIKLDQRQCSTNIFDYSNIKILGGEYLVFEYEYLFSAVQIYLIFVFGQIDLMNIYSVHIRYGFAGYSAYIRYIFEY